MIKNIDNRTTLLGDDLKVELKKGSKIKIAASCFSMYAFNELKQELSNIEELQFLFTSPTFTKENVQACIKATQKEAKVRGKMLYMPLRIATTGIMHGPDLASSICLLGKEKVLSRL